MTPALQQPAALVPAKNSLEQYDRMVDAGVGTIAMSNYWA